MAENRHSVADILNAKKGSALDQYKAASTRLGRLALRRMGDARQLRAAGSDIYFRQAEVATLVELLIESGAIKDFDLDKYLRRVAENMDKTADNFAKQESALHLPGRG
jgi:hypothetical protein